MIEFKIQIEHIANFFRIRVTADRQSEQLGQEIGRVLSDVADSGDVGHEVSPVSTIYTLQLAADSYEEARDKVNGALAVFT